MPFQLNKYTAEMRVFIVCFVLLNVFRRSAVNTIHTKHTKMLYKWWHVRWNFLPTKCWALSSKIVAHLYFVLSISHSLYVCWRFLSEFNFNDIILNKFHFWKPNLETLLVIQWPMQFSLWTGKQRMVGHKYSECEATTCMKSSWN